ncbi:MAG TPA: hypothetical protein VLH94_00275 [Spirochaetia bacterium]|nr:hypothetical protein [Spirochaetia bacterium]
METETEPKKLAKKTKTATRKRVKHNYSIIYRPETHYLVQKAFINKGIYLINPSTGKYLDGCLNAPAIYLTTTPPPSSKNGRQTLGFLPQDSDEKNSQPPKELKIDATLYFNYPTDDFNLGVGKDGILYLVIQTWHDAEIEKWHEIAKAVALEVSTLENGSVIPAVTFYITSTFLPNDPNAPHQLVIKPGGMTANAISGMSMEFSDEEFYED